MTVEASRGKPRASIRPIGRKRRIMVDVSDIALKEAALCTRWSDGIRLLIAIKYV